MNIDLLGKIANTNLPASRPLLPLFDAIVNSIDAIEDRGHLGGEITATVVRDTAQQLLHPDGPDLRPITGFRIEDDGIGFTDENYKSFDTAESRLKRPRGGKGVGRFLWLKAFNTVRVDSLFSENGTRLLARRTFVFSLPDGISEPKVERVSTLEAPGTLVELSGFREPWATECPKGLDVIANRILDHCAGFFLRDNCPSIILRDDSASLSLNDRFAAEYAVAPAVTFIVKGNAFQVRHLKIRDPQQRHRFYLSLSAIMSETATPWKFSVEGEQGSEADERDRAGPWWASDRGGGEGDAAAVHRGVQAEDRPGGRRM